MQRRSILASALVLAVCATGVQAHSHDREKAERLQAAGEVLPLQDVLTSVARDYPGQVLKVEFEDDDSYCESGQPCPERWIYELKILQDQGRLVKIKVDAQSGKVLWAGRRHGHAQGARP